ncbi:hypothetical protein SRABI76_01338 [Microbacterium oxydans]|uniref:Uncharacterized protein n=1 Tax=Microbacterium oxydans TaxID=82380 RepID=A0A0F0LCR0_9MICO|nr:hypothetical protein RS83_01202 [Microbacterium oxydans]CAH0173297.1 hypothetical protein SRABI76_01338 [Microbacterium oxydans]
MATGSLEPVAIRAFRGEWAKATGARTTDATGRR